MSAFLVTSKTESIDLPLLYHTWKTKDIKIVKSSNSICYLEDSQDVREKGYFFEESGHWIYVVGTFFYKEFSFKQSIEFFLKDFIKNRHDNNQMFGHYALLIYHNQKHHILNDALGAIRIFSNSSQTKISTSFLGLWFSSLSPLKLKKIAVFEKIAQGYICAPDTLVQDIEDCTYQSIGNSFLVKIKTKTPIYKKGKKELSFQIEKSQKYFKKIFQLANGSSISLGLSGGFDSRMLLGLLLPYSNKYLFTHHTSGVHNKEMEIAKALCKIASEELSVKETRQPSQLNTEEAEKLLIDLIYYYDGRTANNSGAFSETGTFGYNNFHLHGKAIGVNGKGGEVFRNYYNLPNREYSFQEWFTCLESYYSMNYVFSEVLKKQLLERVESKILERVSVQGKWSRWNIQRYYSEIRQADCEASIVSAHNKITRYIAPYLDAHLLVSAYLSYEKLGSGSEFQMDFIRKLKPDLAAVESNYGYSFLKVPVKFKTKEILLKHIPLRMKNRRLEKTIKKAGDLKLSTTEQTALGFLKLYFPEINTEYCFSHYAQKNVVTNLAYLLIEAQKLNKLDLK